MKIKETKPNNLTQPTIDQMFGIIKMFLRETSHIHHDYIYLMK